MRPAGGSEDVELFWDDWRGWVIRVPVIVPDSALYVLLDFAIKMYIREHNSLPDTPLKRKMEACIKRLDKRKVTQELIKR